MITKQLKMLTAFGAILLSSGCAGKHLTVNDGNILSLEGCDPLPNCVSSSSWILYNKTSQFELLLPPKDAWPVIKKVVLEIPRTEIVENDDVYIHAKCKSLVFRFVDNLELLLHSDLNRISVRSSSSFAIFDFGVNRWRVHDLRAKLEDMKIIKR
jgi:uncharacterized protein (DUF1499 family)